METTTGRIFKRREKVQINSYGKTRSMSTSQAREINKNNKLTIHQAKIVLNNHLRCGNDSLISIFIKLNSLVIFP